MIIFVYGENTYLSQQKVSVMRDQFKEKFDKAGMNLVEFPITDNGKVNIGDVLQAVQTPPFLSEKRMVVVKGLTASLKKPDAKPWVEALQSTPDSTILIFWDSESVKKIVRTELYKQLSKLDNVYTYPMESLAGFELSKWAGEQSRALNLNITDALLQRVVALVGSDLWQLSGELKKLSARAGGDAVTEEMVRDLVKANFEDQIFAFIDAISKRNSREALRLLDGQRQSGSADFQLFSMIGRQVRILLGVRSLLDENPHITKQEVASKMKLHPFVAQKSLAQARGFTFENLKCIHQLVFEFDGKSKRGGISIELAVDRLVIEMAKS